MNMWVVSARALVMPRRLRKDPLWLESRDKNPEQSGAGSVSAITVVEEIPVIAK
jgi:hypothetical protein